MIYLEQPNSSEPALVAVGRGALFEDERRKPFTGGVWQQEGVNTSFRTEE